MPKIKLRKQLLKTRLSSLPPKLTHFWAKLVTNSELPSRFVLARRRKDPGVAESVNQKWKKLLSKCNTNNTKINQ